MIRSISFVRVGLRFLAIHIASFSIYEKAGDAQKDNGCDTTDHTPNNGACRTRTRTRGGVVVGSADPSEVMVGGEVDVVDEVTSRLVVAEEEVEADYLLTQITFCSQEGYYRLWRWLIDSRPAVRSLRN